ncbi:unnamed protein product, partial [Gulo gulo]
MCGRPHLRQARQQLPAQFPGQAPQDLGLGPHLCLQALEVSRECRTDLSKSVCGERTGTDLGEPWSGRADSWGAERGAHPRSRGCREGTDLTVTLSLRRAGGGLCCFQNA